MLRVKSQAGFTLVEVMIALGIGTVAILGTMSMMENTMKSTRNATLMNQFNNTNSNIQALLNDQNKCSTVFQGVLYPPQPSQPAHLARIASQNGALLVMGQTALGLKTTQIDLVETPYDPSKAAAVMVGNKPFFKLDAVLQIAVEKTGAVLGGKTLQQSYPVTVLADPATSKIVGCMNGDISKADLVSEVKAQAKQEICTEMGGSYDVTTGKCSGGTQAQAQQAPAQAAQQQQGGGNAGDIPPSTLNALHQANQQMQATAQALAQQQQQQSRSPSTAQTSAPQAQAPAAPVAPAAPQNTTPDATFQQMQDAMNQQQDAIQQRINQMNDAQ